MNDKLLLLLLTSMVPMIELRGAIPMGLLYNFNLVNSTIISIIGSTLVVPILFFTLRPLINYLLSKGILSNKINSFIEKSLRKSEGVRKYGFWGLVMFVGIPLPGTGAWTGTLIAVLLDMRFKRTILAIFLGNVIAGSIIYLLSFTTLNVIKLIG